MQKGTRLKLLRMKGATSQEMEILETDRTGGVKKNATTSEFVEMDVRILSFSFTGKLITLNVFICSNFVVI
jgi:hypothetical protein